MKRYTTRFFKSVAMFYMSLPITFLLISAVVFDIPVAACGRILLSPLYYIAVFLAFCAGYGLIEMKRWAWYVFIAANAMALYDAAIFANDYGVSHQKTLAFVALLGGMIFLIFRVAREVRVPYFFPRIPWWESDPRYRLSVNVQVTPKSGAAVTGEILDLSLGGCFVKIRDDLWQDEGVSLFFTIYEQEIRCRGIVVWRTQSTVTHPKGVGIKFQALEKAQKKVLRQILRDLRRATLMGRRARQMIHQERFLKSVEETVRERQG